MHVCGVECGGVGEAHWGRSVQVGIRKTRELLWEPQNAQTRVVAMTMEEGGRFWSR